MKLPNKVVGKIFIYITVSIVAALTAVGLATLLISIGVPHVISSDFVISLAYTAFPTFVLPMLAFIFIFVFIKKHKHFFE